MNRPLRILQVSAADVLGGAERIALQLHRAYRRAGHHAWLLVGQRNGAAEPGVLEINNESSRNIWARWWRSIGSQFGSIPKAGRLKTACHFLAEPRRQWRVHSGLEDFNHPAIATLLDELPAPPDVAHLHNLHSMQPYFDLRVLPELSRQVSTFVTLHDAWLTTGHCAHSFDCERWQSGCGQCPDLKIYPSIRRDATAANWMAKQAIFAECRLYPTAPCEWLMQRIKESMLWPAVVGSRVIPNGVDVAVFKPISKAAARAALGLPADQPIAIAMTGGVGNAFKDRRTLLAAVDRLAELVRSRWTMVLLGEHDYQQQRGNLTVLPLTTSSQSTVATYLAAADVLLHVAHVDTFPNSILEAMACGTPVVATAVGGIPEQINQDDRPTGFLTPPADVEALAQAAGRVLTDHHLRMKLSTNAVVDVKNRFTIGRQVAATQAFYQSAITS